MRNYSYSDKFINKSNEILNILFNIKSSGRDYPADENDECNLSSSNKKLVTNLMRVNHSGEVSAQGLYIGHALLAKSTHQKKLMLNMAEEEKDHLEWCEKRIKELNGKISIFNPIWFTGSIVMGMLSSFYNDKNALGFIEETENQVTKHLEEHIKKIPKEDLKTLNILKKMKSDEERHRETAHNFGATELPKKIKKIMKVAASIMKFVSFKI